MPPGSEQIAAKDSEIIDKSTAGYEAAWLAEQAALLAAMPSSGSRGEVDGRAALLAALSSATSQARARESVNDPAPLVLPSACSASEHKRRRGELE